MTKENQKYTNFVIRITIGLMFFLSGLKKLLGVLDSDISGIAGMVGKIGFPAPEFFAWILVLSELIFGLLLIVGWKVKFTVWPLIIIMAVATLGMIVPGAISSKGGFFAIFGSSLWFHVLTAVGLLHLYWTGPGKWGADRHL
jgi:putative oxidoreductase